MFDSWWAFALELAWKGTVVLAAACAVNLLLWRGSAAMRHTVWVLALSSLLVLPMFEALLPAWRTGPALHAPAAIAEVRGASTSAVIAVSHRTNPKPRRNGLPVTVFAVWAVGTLFFMRRWRAASAQVERLRMETTILAGNGHDADEAAAHIGLRRAVLLLRSRAEIVPLAAGVREPAIYCLRVQTAGRVNVCASYCFTKWRTFGDRTA